MKEILQIIKDSKKTESIILQKKKEIQKLREENNLVINTIRNKFEISIKPKIEEIKKLEETIIVDNNGNVNVRVGDLLDEITRISKSKSKTPTIVYVFKSKKKYDSVEFNKSNITKDIKKQILNDIQNNQEELALTLEFCSDNTYNSKKFKIRVGPIPVSFANKFCDGSLLIDNLKLFHYPLENEPGKYKLVLYELTNNQIKDFILSLDYTTIDLIDQKCASNLFKKALSNCILTKGLSGRKQL